MTGLYLNSNSNFQNYSFEAKKRQFTYSEVLKITNNFERILGKGGFGTVYHGFIDDIQVAVKMLSSSSVQGFQQFQAEARIHRAFLYKNNFKAFTCINLLHKLIF